MYTYERATTTVSFSVMGKGSFFGGEETDTETLFPVILYSPFLCVNAGFECVFGEWGKLLTLIVIDCNEFLHMLIPISQSGRRAVWMHCFQCVLDH